MDIVKILELGNGDQSGTGAVIFLPCRCEAGSSIETTIATRSVLRRHSSDKEAPVTGFLLITNADCSIPLRESDLDVGIISHGMSASILQ